MKNIKNLATSAVVGIGLALTAAPAFAGPSTESLPAPGVFALVAAAVIGVIALARLRKYK